MGISQDFSPRLDLSYFLYRGSVISRNESVRISNRDKQDVCPGYDDNEDTPIGCYVNKDDPLTVSVIHQ